MPCFVTCQYCGSAYKVSPRSVKRGTRFCSRTCQWAAKRIDPEIPRFIEQPCGICGVIFSAEWDAPKKRRRRFCSHACASQYHRGRFCGEKNPGYKERVPCVCTNCGKDFTKFPSRIHSVKGTKADFCSPHCGYIHNHGITKERTCIEVSMSRLLQDAGIAFREQVPMCHRWVVDFIIDEWSLIIFCDGVYWHNRPKVVAKDRGQTAYLKKCGWHVLRFTDDEINNHSASCLARILAYG